MAKNEQGTILIEFVGSFLLFVLLMLSILSLVNIGTMQARMHYALTQTANTLSTYGYVLHVIGLDKPLINLAGGAAGVAEEANASIDEINDLLANVNSLNLPGITNSAGTATNRFVGWADSAGADPKGTLQKLAQYGLGEASSLAFAEMIRPLVAYHLSNGGMSGDEYLRSVGVDGVDSLKFSSFRLPGYTAGTEGELVGSLTGLADSNSSLLNKDGNVRITVQYEMKYDFMGLKMPWGEPKLKVTQSVMTKMWLGGRGDGYKKD